MQQLISFVRDHFFIVLIVLGFIYSMFFRKSPLEKRNPNRMPDFGGGPLIPGRPTRPPGGSSPAERKRPSAERTSPPPVERRQPLPEYRAPVPAEPPTRRPLSAAESDERMRGSERPVAVEPDVPVTRQARPVFVAVTDDVPEQRANAGLQLGDDTARAVVWAEILGPPRAKRPFRR